MTTYSVHVRRLHRCIILGSSNATCNGLISQICSYGASVVQNPCELTVNGMWNVHNKLLVREEFDSLSLFLLECTFELEEFEGCGLLGCPRKLGSTVRINGL